MIKFSRVRQEYGAFSNFADCVVAYKGLTYRSSEAAWQAQKCPERASEFTTLNASEAKRLGRHVALRSAWEEIKYSEMVDVLRAKFTQHPKLRDLLLSTGDEVLVEDTTGWHDNTWGNCDCARCSHIKGKNWLGKALMEVRTELMDAEHASVIG